MSKKDLLKKAMANVSKPTFTPIKPMSLDDKPEQPNDQQPVNNTIVNPLDKTLDEILEGVNPPRKNVKAKLPKRKWGKVNTSRYSFEITDELKEKLNKRVAEIQLTTGKKVSASEIIRQALARELRDL